MTEGWGSIRLGLLSTLPVTAGTDHVAGESIPGDLRYVRTTDIKSLASLGADPVGIPPEAAGSAVVRQNDILMTRSGSLGTSYFHRSAEEMAYAGYLVRVRPDTALCVPAFLAWWTQSTDHLDQINVGATRSTIDNFSASKFSAMRVPLPPIDEQRRIADYLNRETAEIDAMDAELDRLVETLRERDLRLNQSSIDMSGHPEVGLAYLGSVTLGKMLDQDKNVGDPTPYVRAANITTAGSVSLDDIKEMRMTDAERARLDIRGGDTLMIEGGDAGRVAFVPTVMHGMSFQKTVLRIRPTHPDLDPRYLYLALRQAHRSGRIALVHSTSTIPHFTAEKAERLLVPVPSLIEQRKIVAEIDGQTVQVNEMVASAERLKALLAERRSTLITEVVTGVKEVPV
jgi:type I restriction enzyme S subunit